jgi:phospholipid N-methyltransferase
MASTASPVAPKQKSNRLLFLQKFLKHGMQVASIVPSSRTLCEALVTKVDSSRPQTIIDVGAGTGAITEVAIERMHPESRVLAVELDPQFAAILAERCPRADVIVGDVRYLTQQLRERGVEQVDVLICGLALPCIPRTATRGMFEAFAEFGRDAWYTQLTLVPYVYRSMYHRLFEEVDFRFVPQNLPPGGAYHCRGLRDGYLDHVPGKV